MLFNFFKTSKECKHLHVPVDVEEAYCPDCGQLVKNKWYLVRCSCCNIKRIAHFEYDKIKPETKFCPNCGSTEFYIEEPSVVAIGKFDGFHCGHQRLLRMVKEQKEKGFVTVVFTFVPSPAAYFSKENVKELTTIEEKRSLFEKAEIDYLIEYPFYKEIADMEPERFIKDVLVKRIHAKCIVAGEDVSFGRHGAGNYQLLCDKSEECGYEVVIIEKVQYEGREVSSTYVREEVIKGNMDDVFLSVTGKNLKEDNV